MIKRYDALTQPQAPGLGLNVFISISLMEQSKATLAKFECLIAEHDEVMECYLMTGDSDYLIRAAIADMGAQKTCQTPPATSRWAAWRSECAW